MITLKLNENESLKLRDNVNDFTKEVIKKHVENIDLADHYCIIGLIGCIKPYALAVAKSDSKSKSLEGVFPVIAKVSGTTIKPNSIGNLAYLNRSDIEMGLHLNSSFDDLSINKVYDEIRLNKKLEDILLSKVPGVAAPKQLYFIEYKIVPESAIKAIKR